MFQDETKGRGSRPSNIEGEFLYHEPCDACGSSDAKAVYDSGTAYCFSCGQYYRDDGKSKAEGGEAETDDVGDGSSARFIEGRIISLEKRGLRAETTKKYNYSVAKLVGTPVQVATYHDQKKRLVAQHLRYPDKDFSWIGKPRHAQLFGQHLWPTGGKQLIITEGEIDCMSIAQALGLKWPVVSVPNGANSAAKDIKRNLEWCESFEKIILAFDDDEAGREAANDVAPLFTPGKVRIMSYDGQKDANDLLRRDPKRIVSNVFNARIYRPDGIISGEDLWEDIIKPPEEGWEVPYPKLNEKFIGLKKGELYMFTAGSGIGKSTLVHELGYHMMSVHGHTLGIMALEESKRVAAERYLSLYLNQPLHINREVSDEKLREAFEATAGSGRFWLYDHWGSTEIDNLIGKVRYMAVGLGVDWILIDHISIVVSGLDELGESERKMIDKLMTKLRSLINETGVGVMAVVHLKRPNNQGKSYNEGRQVSLTDLRGSGALEQLSDGVIALERNQQDAKQANYSLVRVLKNRRVGRTGEADYLYYDEATGRMSAVDAPPMFDDAEEEINDF